MATPRLCHTAAYFDKMLMRHAERYFAIAADKFAMRCHAAKRLPRAMLHSAAVLPPWRAMCRDT